MLRKIQESIKLREIQKKLRKLKQETHELET